MSGDPRCIAVFDSGIGGLTVVRAIRGRLPAEDIAYFGDTARVPYGIKSAETVIRFAREDCDFLLRMNPKMIVVACNTASAAALPALVEHCPVPVCGVVHPGAREAVRKADGRPIGVIATESTINSNAYRNAIRHYAPSQFVVQRACPLFVPMAEEGRDGNDALVRAAAREYLQALQPMDPRVLVLGCTHYPLLREAIAAVMGPDVLLVDSADQTAQTVHAQLQAADALKASAGEAGRQSTGGSVPRPLAGSAPRVADGSGPRAAGGLLTCYVSDNPQRFREIGQRFLGEPLLDVTCLSPEEFFASHSPSAL